MAILIETYKDAVRMLGKQARNSDVIQCRLNDIIADTWGSCNKCPYVGQSHELANCRISLIALKVV